MSPFRSVIARYLSVLRRRCHPQVKRTRMSMSLHRINPSFRLGLMVGRFLLPRSCLRTLEDDVGLSSVNSSAVVFRRPRQAPRWFDASNRVSVSRELYSPKASAGYGAWPTIAAETRRLPNHLHLAPSSSPVTWCSAGCLPPSTLSVQGSDIHCR